jgi:predicted MPP superfamily phosphohydrolase
MSFFFAVTAILLAGFIYIGSRVISPLRMGRRKKRLVWVLFLTVPFIFPLTFFFMRSPELELLGSVSGWAAYTFLGYISLVFILLVLNDVLRLAGAALGAAGRLTRRIASGVRLEPRTYDPGRRRFLTNAVNAGILSTSGLLTGYGLYEARRRPAVERVTIPLDGLPPAFEGYRIVQISDMHVGPTIKRDWSEMVTEIVNGQGADAVVFTGDLPDGSVPALRDDVAPLARLEAPDGLFFVTGNHEYYSGVLPWLDEVRRLGFTVLINEHRLIERDGGKIVMAGITDWYGGDFLESHRMDPEAALAGAPPGAVRILLAHQPRQIFAAAKQGVDLQLSGHTHGGQYIFWNVLAALQQPYIKGLHRYGSCWIYVNRGTGYWGPPLRIGVPSEITLISLTRAGETAPASTA